VHRRNNRPVVPDITRRWIRSSFSGPTGGNCVEVAFLADGQVAVRNSRHADGPALLFTSAEWNAFLRGTCDGEFDQPTAAG
jgi:Domain of unknown function (DUF397)